MLHDITIAKTHLKMYFMKIDQYLKQLHLTDNGIRGKEETLRTLSCTYSLISSAEYMEFFILCDGL